MEQKKTLKFEEFELFRVGGTVMNILEYDSLKYGEIEKYERKIPNSRSRYTNGPPLTNSVSQLQKAKTKCSQHTRNKVNIPKHNQILNFPN